MKLPIHFEVEAKASSGFSTTWNSQAGDLAPIPCAVPPDFMGPGGGYSPEDLFSLSLLNCLIATYKVYCEKNKISFQEIQGKAIATMDKSPSEKNRLHISKIEVFLDVKGASDREKARALLDSTIQDCAISNSIKSGKTFHIKVE